MGIEEKYLREISSKKKDLKRNYESYNQDKVDAITDEINLLVNDLEKSIKNLPRDLKLILGDDLLTAKEKTAIRDYIDNLKPFDLQRHIKRVIW